MYKPPSLTLMYAPTMQAARAQWNRRVGRSQMRTDERVCCMGKTKEGDDADFSMRAGDAGRVRQCGIPGGAPARCGARVRGESGYAWRGRRTARTAAPGQWCR